MYSSKNPCLGCLKIPPKTMTDKIFLSCVFFLVRSYYHVFIYLFIFGTLQSLFLFLNIIFYFCKIPS